ncbi:metallophosphoesterase [archaeon]|nr:metallophosphoesterase [archaeon]
MKILAFADHHGSPSDFAEVIRKAKEVDLIICLGDFTIFENEIEYIMNQIDRLPKKVLLLHGNHEDEDTTRFLSEHSKNIQFLHEAVFETGKYAFIGYGGGGFATTDPRFEMVSKKFPEVMKGKKTILLLHGPPYGTKQDLLAIGHVGCKSFRKFIEEHQPALVLCGHLHETFYTKDKIGKSKIINPGPDGQIIDI